MRDYSYNKLFDFIKSKFSSDVSEDWNTPPDFVFEKAIKRIDQQNKQTRYLWYRRMGIISIIFLVFSSLMYLNLKIDSVDSKIISQENNNASYSVRSEVDDKGIVASTDLINESQIQSESDQVENKIELYGEPSGSLNKNVYPLTTNTNGVSTTNISTYSSFNSEQSQQEASKTMASNLNSAAKSDNLVEKSIGERAALISIDPVQSDIQFIPISQDNNIVLKALPAALNESDIDNAGNSVIVGLRMNSNFSSVSMDNIIPNENISLTGYEQYCSGFGASIDVAKSITNNVSIKATGQFQKIRNNSLLQERSSIDVNNYIVDSNGSGAYETGMTISTPLGNYTSDISFAMDENTLNAKEDMVNKTSTTQSLSYVSLDLGLQYTINPESRSAFYVGAGIGANKTVGMTNQMETDIYMDDKLMDQLSASPKSLDDFKSSFWTYYTEAGIAYSLSNNSDLSVFVNQRMSLNSIKESGMTGSQTYLKQFNVGVGYNFRF